MHENTNHRRDAPVRPDSSEAGSTLDSPVSDIICTLGCIAIASCDLPAIPVTIGKMNVPALVDSGSAASLIDFSLLFKLPALRKITVKSLSFSCLDANSKRLEVVGSFSYKIRVHNYIWKIPFFVVENLVSPLILGTNFMNYSGLILDLPEKNSLSLIQENCGILFPLVNLYRSVLPCRICVQYLLLILI